MIRVKSLKFKSVYFGAVEYPINRNIKHVSWRFVGDKAEQKRIEITITYNPTGYTTLLAKYNTKTMMNIMYLKSLCQ